MVDWASGTAQPSSVAERDGSFLCLRVPGTPDVFKQTPVSGFVTRDASNVSSLAVGSAGVKSGIGSAFVAGQGELYTVGAGAMGVGTTGAGPLIFYTNSTERGRFDSSGNFGIGTNAPDSKLHVIAGAVASLRIGFAGTSVNYIDADINSFRTIAGTEIFRSFSTGVRPGADNNKTLGDASFRWSVVYAGTGAINTSDERLKNNIEAIPDEWLDAWADVQWRRFKFSDGVRWHVGLIAQEVHAAFAAHDLDAFEIGLCCFDEWDEQREPIIEDGIDTGETCVTLEAGDRWGLRYDECQAMEAVYQRRENARMAARLEALELGA